MFCYDVVVLFDRLFEYSATYVFYVLRNKSRQVIHKVHSTFHSHCQDVLDKLHARSSFGIFSHDMLQHCGLSCRDRVYGLSTLGTQITRTR